MEASQPMRRASGSIRLHAWVAVGSISGLRGGPLDPGGSVADLVVKLEMPVLGPFGAFSEEVRHVLAETDDRPILGVDFFGILGYVKLREGPFRFEKVRWLA